jgi:hypothetical protein
MIRIVSAAVMLLTLTIGNNAAVRSQAHASSDKGWVTYTHPTVPFSFRHPPGLTVALRDLSSFNIEGLVAAVDLVDSRRSRPVLRFMVSEPARSHLAVDYDESFLRNVCTSYEAMKIGERDAVSCVTCGRGACQWVVHVLGQRQFRIMSFLTREEGKRGPTDGEYPLLTIIRSLESR